MPNPYRVAVLFGSHSGNTERYAKSLHSELKWRLDLSSSLGSLTNFSGGDFRSLREIDSLLLLLSTYGEGEPNPNTRRFWNCIFNASNCQPFSFSVLSRGSSLYDTTFAKAGIRIDEQLLKLGAKHLSLLGIQDKTSRDNHNQYFDWKEGVISGLKAKYQLQEHQFRYIPSLVAKISSKPNKTEPLIPNLVPNARMVPFKSKILQVTDRTYIHAKLHLPGYKTGDYVMIWPSNSQSTVNRFMKAMFGSENQHVQLGSRVVSYEELAKHTIDINGMPERELLLKLADLAPSKLAQLRVKRLIEQHLTMSLTEILEQTSPETPWISNFPLSALIDVLPQLQPRRYSACSSSAENPEWAGITAVVEKNAETGFLGVATGELYRNRNNHFAEIIAAYERVPEFRLPESTETPLILVGVGTGVAPFRGFLRERVFNKSCGKILLFTGTRTAGDLVHKAEFDSMPHTKLIPAYSREPQNPNYGYFSEKILDHGDEVFKFLQEGAHIYVCGDIRKVRRGVRNAVAEILAKKLRLSSTEGQREWKKLKAAKRLHIELW